MLLSIVPLWCFLRVHLHSITVIHTILAFLNYEVHLDDECRKGQEVVNPHDVKDAQQLVNDAQALQRFVVIFLISFHLFLLFWRVNIFWLLLWEHVSPVEVHLQLLLRHSLDRMLIQTLCIHVVKLHNLGKWYEFYDDSHKFIKGRQVVNDKWLDNNWDSYLKEAKHKCKKCSPSHCFIFDIL